jgi:hypothetical protein
VSPRCDGGTHNCLETRRQQGDCIIHISSESGPKKVTIWRWSWLVAAGRCRLLLVAAGRLQLHHGDAFVILVAVPSSEADAVKGGPRIDGVVVEGSRLVVEKLGGIHGENRNGGGVDQARCVGVHVFYEVGSPHDSGRCGRLRRSKSGSYADEASSCPTYTPSAARAQAWCAELTGCARKHGSWRYERSTCRSSCRTCGSTECCRPVAWWGACSSAKLRDGKHESSQ